MYDVWTLDDAQAFRCTLAQVGCPRPAQQLLPAAVDPRAIAAALAPFALRQLARLAQGSGFPAVAAARELLKAAELAKGPFPQTGEALPDWVDERQRLSFAANVQASAVNCLGNENDCDSRSQSGDISQHETEGGAVSGSGGAMQLSSALQTDSPQKPPPLSPDSEPTDRKETFDDPFERAGPSPRKYA